MDTPSPPSYVIVAFDATKARNEHEFSVPLHHVQTRGDILRGGDTIIVLGVLHRVTHPMGYQVSPNEDAFTGTNSTRAMEEEVSKKTEAYMSMLLKSAKRFEDEGDRVMRALKQMFQSLLSRIRSGHVCRHISKVSMEVKTVAGAPVKHVILQEALAYKPTWVILDRHLRRDIKFYLKHVPCKAAFIQDGLTVDPLKSNRAAEAYPIEHRLFYSISKPILSLAMQGGESKEQYFISSIGSSDRLKADFGNYQISENAGVFTKEGKLLPNISKKNLLRVSSLEVPILCATCGTRTELDLKDSMSFSEVQFATNNFSKENLVGEGGYGYVYQGKLRDGQQIAAKVRKEASAQGFEEFRSEIYALSFARHKNIVMLLGYCCEENFNVLVYEYICNRSLYWHLFDETASVLEWHRRYSIAIGTAKGLRFLHEECRGGPIIHRDMRPSNILLTHDFVPMLGDFGLAKWKTSEELVQTRVLGTLGYLAPEYAENGTVSIRTDVYAFGIILLQLISGCKVVDRKKNKQDQSLRQRAEQLIENMELHELIDPRIGDSYDTYELYLMARAAYSCIQRNPELRPSMGEVVRFLEGRRDQVLNSSSLRFPAKFG